MDVLLHRIEALPGDGRFAATFASLDGIELTAVIQLRGDAVEVAEASLPAGFRRADEAFDALVEAIRAMARSRTLSAPVGGELRDPEGGWDVSLGNVVLGASGVPSCIAHGDLEPFDGGRWVCPECGAQALFAAP